MAQPIRPPYRIANPQMVYRLEVLKRERRGSFALLAKRQPRPETPLLPPEASATVTTLATIKIGRRRPRILS